MLVRNSTDLGLLLREQRRRLGLSQQEVADRVGVSRQWVVEVEGGKPGAGMDLVLRTIEALDLRVDVDVRGHRLSAESGRLGLVGADVDLIVDRARKKR